MVSLLPACSFRFAARIPFPGSAGTASPLDVDAIPGRRQYRFVRIWIRMTNTRDADGRVGLIRHKGNASFPTAVREARAQPFMEFGRGCSPSIEGRSRAPDGPRPVAAWRIGAGVSVPRVRWPRARPSRSAVRPRLSAGRCERRSAPRPHRHPARHRGRTDRGGPGGGVGEPGSPVLRSPESAAATCSTTEARHRLTPRSLKIHVGLAASSPSLRRSACRASKGTRRRLGRQGGWRDGAIAPDKNA